MNAGLPRMLTKKNTGLVDIIVFIVKYCLLLDTSELFIASKMQLNNEIVNKKPDCDCKKGFDLMDFFTDDLFSGNMLLTGGADKEAAAAPAAEEQKKEEPAATKKEEPAATPENRNSRGRKIDDHEAERRLKEQNEISKVNDLKKEANNEFQKKEQQKSTLEEGVKTEVESKLEERYR